MTSPRLTITAPDHLQATVDVWLAALRLLPSDARALAALMKSDTPLPTSIRYLLGELLHPGRPPLLDVQAVPKQTNAFTKAVDKLSVGIEHRQRTSTGESSQTVAEDIAERLGVSSRQVFRWLNEETPEQFKSKLLDFTDKNNSQNVSDAPARVAHHDADSANDFVIGQLSMVG